jgi:hypothetical protein
LFGGAAYLVYGRGTPIRSSCSQEVTVKRKLLPLALIGGAIALLRNSKARRRAGELGSQAVGAVQGLLDRGKGDKRELPVSPYRVTPTGDVESEDQGGSWADDGGSGKGGGQASETTPTTQSSSSSPTPSTPSTPSAPSTASE